MVSLPLILRRVALLAADHLQVFLPAKVPVVVMGETTVEEIMGVMAGTTEAATVEAMEEAMEEATPIIPAGETVLIPAEAVMITVWTIPVVAISYILPSRDIRARDFSC